jgi:hypothetical protein
MPHSVRIGKIYKIFARHDRNYCIFSVTGNDDDFLFYSHRSHTLRSLIFGRDFLCQLPHLMENEDLCIECGLGLSVAGGIARDGRDWVEWHYTITDANRMLSELKEVLGEQGRWIELF